MSCLKFIFDMILAMVLVAMQLWVKQWRMTIWIRRRRRKMLRGPCYDPIIRSKHLSNMVATKKSDRRVWSAEEETLLVDILYDMNNTGWKVDTGHKSGYLSFIEKEMAKKLPNSNIRAYPHIKSKIKVMKKHLTYILEIKKYASSFDWDDEQKMVTGDRDVFMGWAKSRNGASNLWMKPMIHYDKLVEIYATELAKGPKVKGPGDLFDMDEDQSNINAFEVSSLIVDEYGSQSQVNTTPVSTRESLKRKACDDPTEKEFIQISKSVPCLLEVVKENTLAMNAIKNAFVHDVDVNEENKNNRKNLFKVIVALPGLDQEEVVMATRLIGQDPAKLDLFYGMPDMYKVIFAQQEIAQSKSK